MKKLLFFLVFVTAGAISVQIDSPSYPVEAAFDSAKCVQNFGPTCIDNQGKPRCLTPYSEGCGDNCTRQVTCGNNGEFRAGACECTVPQTPQCPVATIWNGSICEGTAQGTAYETQAQAPVENGGNVVADNGQHGGREISREEANTLSDSPRGGGGGGAGSGTRPPSNTVNRPLTAEELAAVSDSIERCISGNNNPTSAPVFSIDTNDSLQITCAIPIGPETFNYTFDQAVWNTIKDTMPAFNIQNPTNLVSIIGLAPASTNTSNICAAKADGLHISVLGEQNIYYYCQGNLERYLSRGEGDSEDQNKLYYIGDNGNRELVTCNPDISRVIFTGTAFECVNNNNYVIPSNTSGSSTFHLFPKAYAQELPPTPELIDIDNLRTGEYVITIPGYESATVTVVNDGIQLKFFEDTNDNGVQDPGEPDIDVRNFLVQISKTKAIERYNLAAGWNLINIPVFDSVLTKASDLANYIRLFGGNPYQISKYDNGNWIHYITRSTEGGERVEFGGDFSLVPGEAYFVNVESQSLFVITGNDYTSNPPLNIRTGWNLIGVSGPTPYTSTNFLQKCISLLPGCKTLSRWIDGNYQSVIFEDDIYFGNEFRLERRVGYFLLNKGNPDILIF